MSKKTVSLPYKKRKKTRFIIDDKLAKKVSQIFNNKSNNLKIANEKYQQQLDYHNRLVELSMIQPIYLNLEVSPLVDYKYMPHHEDEDDEINNEWLGNLKKDPFDDLSIYYQIRKKSNNNLIKQIVFD